MSRKPDEDAPNSRDRVSAQRLRRLQQATAALARAADAAEIARALGSGVAAVLDASGVFVLNVVPDRTAARVLYQTEHGTELPARDVELGEGAISKVARLGEALESLGGETERAAAVDSAVISADTSGNALILLPVMHGRRLLGLAGAWRERRNAFDAEAVDAAKMLATQAGMALSNAELLAESERERRQIEALADAARAVSESLRMGEVVRLILRHATGLLRGEGACVALHEGNYLHIVAAIGMADLMAGVHLSLTGGLAGRAVREGTTVIANDVHGEASVHRTVLRFADVRRAIVAPLSTARGVLGALMVFNRPEEFGADDARVLQRLADQVAVAIVNAKLFEEVTEASRAWTSTFDAIGVAMAVVDDAGRIVRYNTRARQLAAETDSRELAGRPFYEAILGGAPAPNDERPVELALREGTIVRTIMQMPGTGRRLQMIAAPHLDSGVIVTFDAAPDLPSAAAPEHNPAPLTLRPRPVA